MPDNIIPEFSVVILAAGKGKRMLNPYMAKVMALLDGKPLIAYVLDVVKNLSPQKTIVVVGFQKQSVIDFIKSQNYSISFAEQTEQLGTGHAVAQTEKFFNDYKGSILILAGDVPLLKVSTLKKFIENHFEQDSDVSVLSTYAPDPTGYGRIVRTDDGEFLKIVEEKDAYHFQKKFKEINSGIFIVSSEILFDALKKVSNQNAQGEYYLTDIIEILYLQNFKVTAYPGAAFDELQGVNSPEDLERAEKCIENLE